MRSLVILAAVAGLAVASCGDDGDSSGDAGRVTATTSTVVVSTSASASPTTQPRVPSPAPIVPVSESELLESITPGSARTRTVTPIADVSGLNGYEALASLRNQLNIHSCNELHPVDVLGEIDDEGLVATWERGSEVVLAGTPDALHAAFVVLAAWLENCGERPYTALLEVDDYEVYQEPVRRLSIGEESFIIDYGLRLRDLPFCDHKLVVVRDDDRLVIIDTYGTSSVPVPTNSEVVAKAEEAVAKLHTS